MDCTIGRLEIPELNLVVRADKHEVNQADVLP